MHELGIVFQIIKTVEQACDEESIDVVVLELGEVSGVVDSYLIDCWKWSAKRSDTLKNSKLVIEEIPAITYCENCERTYPTVTNGKICPHCESDQTYLLQGNEMNVKEVRVCDVF